MRGIGYELERVDYTPPEFWFHRCRLGRRVASFGPYSTEEKAREELAAQEELDKDDWARARIVPEREENEEYE